MVSCPICGKGVSLDKINTHLDQCENGENIISAPSQPVKKQLTLSSLGRKPSNLGTPAKKPSTQQEPITIDDDDDDEDDDPKEEKSNSPPLKKPNTSLKTPITTPDKDSEIKLLRQQAQLPLSERLRPRTLDEYVGQSHLIGPQGILRGFIDNDTIPSLILWGPPGVGKTTIARIIAARTKQKFVELNATSSGISDLRKIFENCSKEWFLTKRKTIVFCDEIHRYNKTQQDFFLPFVEKGECVLIGATTENPSFQLNNALLSRCKVFTLNKLQINEIHRILNKGILHINKVRKLVFNKSLLTFDKEAINYIADLSNGDSRISINLMELIDSHYSNVKPDAKTPGNIAVKVEDIRPVLQKTHLLYDRVGDQHYDTISAFHKSIRGSDPDAAMWYLGKMLSGGENPLYIARRMIRIASEDVGVLDESCLPFAIAAYQAVTFVGLPEADLALVQCAVKLAKAPKSVEIYRAWNYIKSIYANEPTKAGLPIPLHLRNAPTKLMKEMDYGKEYKYNPNYKNGKVRQDYLPEQIKDMKFLDGKHLGDIVDPDL
ncbi:hypothetical protein BN7_1370 [Wickerhamomyces ciferrii]|uniref:UBZ4-type domain-containing protein n=1 Tax=Wickerhamomyces ciferrii (strain ATCC 14091 / BCRC 22168 / CBS 111 / JCM 3599 / NBRC 0793 / NRRL Y-1031 F-60-10) TaxID=1206466 RepID=K0KFY6_WICCF|nr:uncharacterized protein BN7_1370 [Wickerhamomyces ciferrii]CCH41831.1 hypothetical protein BN7_1370 [Wickerhamomyces ciferrii]